MSQLRKNLKIAAFSLLFLSSCALIKPSPGNRESSPIAPGRDVETIAIVGTNDIHGSMAPTTLTTHDAKPVEYQAGGLAYFSSYLNILRSELGSRVIWLDGGDQWQGALEGVVDQGATMVRALNTMGLKASAIGNHEFDFGTSVLQTRISEAQFPYLAANVRGVAGAKESIIIDVGHLKVGIFGLTTPVTAKTSLPARIQGVEFSDLKDTALRESADLRKRGADVVVLVSHAGLACDLSFSPRGHALRKPTDMQGDCAGEHEIVQLLKSVPAGTIDAVVAGHTHALVHHWVAGVPVIEAGANGRYFEVLYLAYDHEKKQVLPEYARIEGPVPICPKVFSHQDDCNGERPAPHANRGELVTPKFHGRKISADSSVSSVMESALGAAQKAEAEIVGHAARPIPYDRFGESALGNLIVDSARTATNSDIGIMNAGGIRLPLEQGPIRYAQLFRSVPYDNTLVVVRVNGATLKKMLQVAESGSRGFFPVSGVKLKVLSRDYDSPNSKDLDGDDKIDPWEVNRLLETHLEDGSDIDEKKEYKVAIPDFLAFGGDDFEWVMSLIPADHREFTGKPIRDTAADYIRYLSSKGPINAATNPLVKADAPRILFVQKAPGATKKRRHHRHGSHKKHRKLSS